jgi:diguanylate cyclase (GGDEF)-like protein
MRPHSMSEPGLTVASLPAMVAVDLAWQQPGRSELAERIARALAALTQPICTTRAELPPDRPIDLVISERPSALADLGLQADVSAGCVGLIVLGTPAPKADAQLPLDFTDRELLLACRLVGEIVALRRRSHDVERNSHELARLAAADPLTGLANRRAWDAEAPDRLRRARLAGQAVCLAIFDVDRFKAVNGGHGYAAGDAALAAVGRELAGALHGSDLIARLGGDEFAALLVGHFDQAGALAIVDRVRSAAPEPLAAQLGFELTLSAGCALAIGKTGTGDRPHDLAAMLAAADGALREAKRAGRDRSALA